MYPLVVVVVDDMRDGEKEAPTLEGVRHTCYDRGIKVYRFLAKMVSE